MIETHHLKNVVIFIQTILGFVLTRKIIFFLTYTFLKFMKLLNFVWHVFANGINLWFLQLEDKLK